LSAGAWLSPYLELTEEISGMRSERFVIVRSTVAGLLMDVTTLEASPNCFQTNIRSCTQKSVAYDNRDMDNVLVDIDAMLGREDAPAAERQLLLGFLWRLSFGSIWNCNLD